MALPRSITNLQTDMGDAGAILSQGRTQSKQVAESTPDSEAFGLAVMDMLRNYQGAFSRQQFGAQEQQTTRAQAPLPPDLANMQLSGADQLAFRKGEIGAVEPTVKGAEAGQKTVSGHLAQIADIMKFQQTSKDKARDDARNVIKDALTLGGADSLKSLSPELIKEIEKTAGYPTGYIEGLTSTLRERELELKRQNAATNRGLTEYQKSNVLTRLNENISKNATYSKTTSMRNYGDNVIAALNIGTGVSDIAAINQFQKVIDEGAVTRDQDVKLIQGAQSLINRLKTKIKNLEKGDQLSPTQRKEMKTVIDKMYAAQVKALLKDPYITAKKREAELNGLDVEDTILGELESFQRTTDDPSDWQKIPDKPTSSFQSPGFSFNQQSGGSTSQFLR